MRKPSSLFALILTPVFLCIAQGQISPQQLVQDAMQKQQSGDLEGAVPEYKQFLKLHPEVAAIHSNLGAALAGLGRYEEALPEYKTALRLSPKLEGARLNLALVYYKMGKIDDATTQLEKVTAEDPANHQAVLLLADCYSRMGREDEVIRVLEPAEQRYPDDLAIAYLVGNGIDPGKSRGGRATPGRSYFAQWRLGRSALDVGNGKNECSGLCRRTR